MNRAGADDALPQAAGQGEIGDAVEPDLVLAAVEEAGVDEQSFRGQCIFGKCPGEAEEIALSVFPNFIFSLHCRCSFLPDEQTMF